MTAVEGYGKLRRTTDIYFIRHADNITHEWDAGLTSLGRVQAYEAARKFLEEVGDGEEVRLLFAPAERTLETAQEMHRGFMETIRGSGKDKVTLLSPSVCPEIRQLSFLIDGKEIDPSRVYKETYTEVDGERMEPEQVSYYRNFWEDQDPMGYWLNTHSKYVEPPQQVHERMVRFIASQVEEAEGCPEKPSVRLLCVTHFGPIRAFLKGVLGDDVRDLKHCEPVRIHIPGEASYNPIVEFRGRKVLLEAASALSESS